jgi:hypothetical protein
MCSILKRIGFVCGSAGKNPASDPDPPNDDEEYDIQQTSDEHMKIYVKVCMDREIVLDVTPTDTIQLVKAQIQGREGIRWRDQRLHFGHYYRDLQDGAPLHYYNIQDGDLLTLGVRGFGGANTNKRGREGEEESAKTYVLAELTGVFGLLTGFVEQETMQEVRKVEHMLDSWDFLDTLSFTVLEQLDTRVRTARPTELTIKKLVEWFRPIASPEHRAKLLKEKDRIEKSVRLLEVQSEISLTRLLMNRAGFNDFKTFKELLAAKTNFRRGLDASRGVVALPGVARSSAERAAG